MSNVIIGINEKNINSGDPVTDDQIDSANGITTKEPLKIYESAENLDKIIEMSVKTNSNERNDDSIKANTHLENNQEHIIEIPVIASSDRTSDGNVKPNSHQENNCEFGNANITKNKIYNTFSNCLPVEIAIRNISMDIDVALENTEESVFQLISNVVKFTKLILGISETKKYVKKRILHDINATFKPYRLVALMGSSGAGKTTLLNTLSDRITPTEGDVYYNKKTVPSSVIQTVSAYLQQMDMLLPNLTAEEHLKYQVNLRMKNHPTLSEIQERKESLLTKLNLLKVQTSLIGSLTRPGGLSGGERKRLNFASELVNLPSVLFLDEPTTGLDSYAARNLVDILKKLAKSGRTIITTIHQPSSTIFEMFDDVVLLSEGHLIYGGDRLGSLKWFEQLGHKCPRYINAADFLLQILAMPQDIDKRKEKLDQIVKWSLKWKQEGVDFIYDWENFGKKEFLLRNEESFTRLDISNKISEFPLKKDPSSCHNENRDTTNKTQDLSENIKYTLNTDLVSMVDEHETHWKMQLSVLFNRAITSNKRDGFLFYARIVQTLLFGFFFGCLFYNLGWTETDAISRMGGIYIILLNQSMTGAYAVTHTFVQEKPLIRREYESGIVSPIYYILSKMLADIPIQIIFPIIFATIFYYLMNNELHFPRFLIFIIILLLTANAAMSIGYFASSLGNSNDTASVICNLTIMPLTIFGGFIVRLRDVHKVFSWIQYISFLKYGFSNGAITVFRNKTITLSSGKEIDGLEFVDYNYGMNDNIYIISFVILFLLLIIYRAIAIIVFTVNIKKKKEND